MTAQTKQKAMEKISQLLDLEIQGKAEVIVSYAGHCKVWNIRVFAPNWTPSANPSFEENVFMDTSNSPENSLISLEQKVDKILTHFEKTDGTPHVTNDIVFTIEKETKFNEATWYRLYKDGEYLTGSYSLEELKQLVDNIKNNPSIVKKKVEIIDTIIVNH